jgi:hypothetical protein
LNVGRDAMHDYRAIFDALSADPRYLRNLDWGEARSGHPEGTIRAHIAELEQNLAKMRSKLSDEQYWKLRLLIHSHDTFKPDADPAAPIASPQSHASLARAFLSSYCDDADLLNMVQFHDEPYALWRQAQSKGKFNQKRFEALMGTIRDWNLFLAFLIIDGCTAGKSREPLRWMFEQVNEKVDSKFTAAEIL